MLIQNLRIFSICIFMVIIVSRLKDVLLLNVFILDLKLVWTLIIFINSVLPFAIQRRIELLNFFVLIYFVSIIDIF